MDEVLAFAMQAHQGQFRKYKGEPYIVHPIAVRDLLLEHGVTHEAVLSAALLHDVVEDTSIIVQTIMQQFGEDVAQLVYWLTDDDPLKDNNRATRKCMQRWKLAWAPEAAVQIKLADILDNTKDVWSYDTKFATTYFQEKKDLLAAWETREFTQESTQKLKAAVIKQLN